MTITLDRKFSFFAEIKDHKGKGSRTNMHAAFQETGV